MLCFCILYIAKRLHVQYNYCNTIKIILFTYSVTDGDLLLQPESWISPSWMISLQLYLAMLGILYLLKQTVSIKDSVSEDTFLGEISYTCSRLQDMNWYLFWYCLSAVLISNGLLSKAVYQASVRLIYYLYHRNMFLCYKT